MPDNRTEIPLSPRDFLSASRDILGDTWVVNLFRCGVRNLNRWTAKRPYVDEESIRENPIEKYEKLLTRLTAVPGGMPLARASVDRLAAIVGCELKCTDISTPDKTTVADECLDDYPALTDLHDAIRKGAHPAIIRQKKRRAIQEIEETAGLYLSGLY